ncbi:MAG TPA: rhomboid family intramembrane serine protease, partial [Candidatus Angelobacter sp.]
VHYSPGQILTTVISVFFIGSSVEEVTGKRAFYELYLTSLIGAGVLGFLLSLTGRIAGGVAMGAGSADNAILMAFYLFYRGASIYLFPFPFQIPVKWVVIGIGVIEAAYWVLNGYPLLLTVSLLGFGMGYLWHKYMWRRAGLSSVVEERILGLRNSYHRWKRRRAGRKFQVYMRKHQQDPKQYFDEYGNFRPPDDPEKKNGGKGGWVN